jgi:hypothetical protein
VVKFEPGVGFNVIAPAFQAPLVRPVTDAHVGERHRDCLGTVGEHVQVDSGIFVGGSNQHRTYQSRCKRGQ